jgi:hypothetical protein
VHGELSEDGTIWTIPGAPTKNGRQHVVYLPPLAREIIDAVSRVEGKAGYLFTTNGQEPRERMVQDQAPSRHRHARPRARGAWCRCGGPGMAVT